MSGNRERIFSVLRSLGLPVHIPASLDTEGLLQGLKKDKKKEGSKIHFILLKKPGQPFVNGGVPLPLIQETIEALKA